MSETGVSGHVHKLLLNYYTISWNTMTLHCYKSLHSSVKMATGICSHSAPRELAKLAADVGQ